MCVTLNRIIAISAKRVFYYEQRIITICGHFKGQHPGLSDEADTEVQKAAVHCVASGGWLQEGANSH